MIRIQKARQTLREIAARRALVRMHAHELCPGLWVITRPAPRGGAKGAHDGVHYRTDTLVEARTNSRVPGCERPVSSQ